MAQEQKKGVPDHIPARLVWNNSFDAFTTEGDDPFAAICRMHTLPPLIWATDASYGRPGWIATRHDVINEVFMDHAHFSAERPGMIADLVGENVRLNPIEIDPPAHHGYRRNLNPLFTPKAIATLDGSIRDTCKTLIARFATKGTCDFVADFAVPFPSYVFLDLMDMPRDMAPQFIAWEEALMRAPDPVERVAAARAIYEYLKMHKERHLGGNGEGVSYGIVNAQFEGRPLTHLEMMGMFYVLYVGGLDTVYSTLGWIMRHLAGDPALQSRLRDNPDDMGPAIEELTRAYSVVVTHRQVAQDFTFHGVEMRKGEEINLPLALANRDPALYEHPHVVDIDRKSRHINFGTGAHSCLGIHLAKREIRIVLEEFLAHFRNIRIAEGEVYRFHTGRTFGVDYLPLCWDVG
jgi:cytochrome P450